MARPRRNLSRYSFHLTYWLLLPGIGLSLWLTTAWMMDWVLSHSYDSRRYLQTNIYPKAQLSRTLTLTTIYANVDVGSGITEVTLITTDPILERLEFKFPLTQMSSLERALADTLNTTPAAIRSVLHTPTP